jgi:hypothetical protein
MIVQTPNAKAIEQVALQMRCARKLGMRIKYDDLEAWAARLSAASPPPKVDGLTDQLFQAAWFAQPFVKHAAEHADNPDLAGQCLAALDAAIAAYRTTPPATEGAV